MGEALRMRICQSMVISMDQEQYKMIGQFFLKIQIRRECNSIDKKNKIIRIWQRLALNRNGS